MDQETVLLLFEHNIWANRHLIQYAKWLTGEQLTAQVTGFYHGTPFQTILHIVDVEWSWIQACQGKPMAQDLWEMIDLPDLESVERFYRQESDDVAQYLNRLQDHEINGEVDFGSAFGREPQHTKLWHILVHIVTHNIEHRTELGHYLTDCGHSPGELSFGNYLMNVRGQDLG